MLTHSEDSGLVERKEDDNILIFDSGWFKIKRGQNVKVMDRIEFIYDNETREIVKIKNYG